nr:MAG TPA: Cytosine specific methyltransferase [Caudoviricetes sp.]
MSGSRCGRRRRNEEDKHNGWIYAGAGHHRGLYRHELGVPAHRQDRGGEMKLLIGGSPCTHWSIAQTKNRETKAEGIGWELFLNYRIARDKYKPDYFLYENNKSMSPAIREQITAELGVEPVLINSALVSAQNRQRLYWVGKRNPDGTYSQVPVEQPEGRGILLRDILESGAVTWHEKAYTLRASAATKQGVSNVLRHIETNGHFGYMGVAEPVAINPLTEREMDYMVGSHGKYSDRWTYLQKPGEADKALCITANVHRGVPYNICAEPVRIGTIENDAKNPDHDSQQYRVYSPDGRSVTLCGNGGGLGAKTGLYATPVDGPDGKAWPVYEVRDGFIAIKGKRYPIKLRDGCYIIRKLTVTECKRLQTVPDTYAFPVSDTQAYKMLGNGWTVDVIAHIMSHFDGLTAEPVEVLSMYDGMSCGHIALGKLGADVSAYYATEIDKYAIATTQHNYPETIQLGDAFQVRAPDWELPWKEEHT